MNTGICYVVMIGAVLTCCETINFKWLWMSHISVYCVVLSHIRQGTHSIICSPLIWPHYSAWCRIHWQQWCSRTVWTTTPGPPSNIILLGLRAWCCCGVCRCLVEHTSWSHLYKCKLLCYEPPQPLLEHLLWDTLSPTDCWLNIPTFCVCFLCVSVDPS